MIIKDVKKVAIIAGAVAAATVAGTVSAVLIKKHKKSKDEDLEIDEEDFDIEDDEDFDIEDDEEDFDTEDDDEDFDIEDDVDEEGFEISNDKENTYTEGKSEVVNSTEDKEDKEDKAVSCEDVKKVLNHLGIKDEKFINNIIGVGEGVEKAAYNTAKVSKAVAVKTLKKVLKVLEAED